MRIVSWLFGVLRRMSLAVHVACVLGMSSVVFAYVGPVPSREHVLWYVGVGYVSLLLQAALASRTVVSAVISFALGGGGSVWLWVLLERHGYHLDKPEIVSAIIGVYAAVTFGLNDSTWRRVVSQTAGSPDAA